VQAIVGDGFALLVVAGVLCVFCGECSAYFIPGIVERRDLHLLRGDRVDISWLVYVWVWTHFWCVFLLIWLYVMSS